MNTKLRLVALAELLLILPAAIFMIALILRQLPATTLGLNITAQRAVTWYAERQWTLWLLLVALPIATLLVGCATLIQNRQTAIGPPLAALRTQPATLMIAVLTTAAGVILAIVGLHILAN
jgi:hypothetical protein